MVAFSDWPYRVNTGFRVTIDRGCLPIKSPVEEIHHRTGASTSWSGSTLCHSVWLPSVTLLGSSSSSTSSWEYSPLCPPPVLGAFLPSGRRFVWSTVGQFYRALSTASSWFLCPEAINLSAHSNVTAPFPPHLHFIVALVLYTAMRLILTSQPVVLRGAVSSPELCKTESSRSNLFLEHQTFR